MTFYELIPFLLTLAWLAPLAGMVASWIAGRFVVDGRSRLPAWIAVAAMIVSLNLVMVAGAIWWWNEFNPSGNPPTSVPLALFAGDYYGIGRFGGLPLSVGYYIDKLTLVMCFMITLISTAVHVYAVAYMWEGLPDDDLEDAIEAEEFEQTPEEVRHDAQPSTFNPQLARFFTLLQFFTFAMLGLVLAGNLLQMFVFWELVGAASYLLIGFHFERPHAAIASTKAFIMNRVGDAGFLIGMMILWTAFGTFSLHDAETRRSYSRFSGEVTTDRGLLSVADVEFAEYYRDTGDAESHEATRMAFFPDSGDAMPRWWLVAAGLCLFAGCVGKSAQLPLSTWLPDAMAGPTPVSALVHSATMVAAGVYLIGRLYPLFLPDVLIVIAYVGAVTLVYGATCAVVQTDLKRILAYSTISQLGYMMLALGVGGREAGLFHLVTHAFFKSLLFLAAGSVIVACHHVQDLSQMGGLRKKMPFTAYTSLVGVIAIAGLAVPFFHPFGEAIAFSGYHSKDSILAAALHFVNSHPQHLLLFWLPLLTAGITAFYMFRFWWLAFAGRPRDLHLYKQAREPSPLMTGPLVVLAAFAAFVAVRGVEGPLFGMIAASGPESAIWHSDWGAYGWFRSSDASVLGLPAHGDDAHATVSVWGLALALGGAGAACLYYGLRDRWGKNRIKPAELSASPRRVVIAGWMLDDVYALLFIKPLYGLARVAAWFDRVVVDGLVLGFTRLVLAVARFDRVIDEHLVDGFVNRLAEGTYAAGRGLRHVQTGHLRQYVVALAVATIMLFALAIVLVPRVL